MKRTSGSGILIIASLFMLVTACEQNQRKENAVIIRDKAQISYRDTGTGGATLLFVHGLGADQSYWDKQVAYFGADYRVVTFDLPGHGASGKERPHWSLRGYAGDVYTLIKRLDLKNVILIGHTHGGDINLMAATYRPKNIIGFIGIDNFKNAGIPLQKQNERNLRALDSNLEKDFESSTEKFVRSSLVSEATPSTISDRIARDFSRAHKAMFADIVPTMFELYREEARLLSELKVKMHLINVSNSPTNTNVLKKLLPNGFDLQTIDGTSNFPMLENPDELNILLRQAIEDISRENDLAKKPL